MRNEPRLQLGVFSADGIKDDDLVRLDETSDVEDRGEDDMLPDEDRGDEIGGHGVYAAKITRLSTI